MVFNRYGILLSKRVLIKLQLCGTHTFLKQPAPMLFDGLKLWQTAVTTKKPDNNAIGLVSKMIENNIQPNAATYELLMLHFAHFDDLSHTESLISSIWGVSLDPVDKEGEATPTQGSLAYPTYYTLVAIINAFGSNGELVRGLQLMQEMQNKYKIDIGKRANH